MNDKELAIQRATNPSENVAKGALTDFGRNSFSDGNIVVGVAVNHIAVSWNETTYNKNQLLVLQKADLVAVFPLLFSAMKARGWLV